MPSFLFLLLVLPFTTLASRQPLQLPLTTSTKTPLHATPPFKVFSKNTPFYTLNDTYHPSKYTLELSTYLDEDDGALQFTAPGKVAIQFRVTEVTNRIILHVNPALLTVTRPSVNVTDMSTNTVYIPTSIEFSNDDRHYMYVNMPNTLNTTLDYVLQADFVAKINTESLDGLYLSYYTDSNGILRWVTLTNYYG